MNRRDVSGMLQELHWKKANDRRILIKNDQKKTKTDDFTNRTLNDSFNR